MDELTANRIIAEAKKRLAIQKLEEQQKADLITTFSVKSWLETRTHEKQYNFLMDRSRFSVAFTSRQSGKTKGISKSMLIEPIVYQNPAGEPAVFAYVSLTKSSARAIIWNDILRTIDEEKMDKYVKSVDNTRNLITFKNGNEFRLFGAKDINDVEKIRGLRIRLVFIDEAQSFKDKILKYLVEEVLTMGLIANNGIIKMTGTPNAWCSGYFYDACNNIVKGIKNTKFKNWSIHTWNLFDNKYLVDSLKSQGTTLEKFLEETYGMKGIDENDPSYKREAMGLWIKSIDSLMYKYYSTINSHDFSKFLHEYKIKEAIIDIDTAEKIDWIFKSTRYNLPVRKEWFYVLGMDFGFGDDCAWVVYAFNKEDEAAYVIETINHSGVIPSVAAELTKQLNEHYNFYKIVGDSGGIGKSYIEEMKHRFGLHVLPAEKTQKSAYIKLMNDSLRMAKIKADPSSDIVEEWGKNVWEVVGVKEKEGQDNHLSDAALYGWRECINHITYSPTLSKSKVGTQEHYDRLEEELEEREDQEILDEKNKEWWEK